MIRRSWVIYQRRSRQIISTVYHRYGLARDDLRCLNDYCEKKKYAMQVTRTNSETGEIVSRYPVLELKELPNNRREGDG